MPRKGCYPISKVVTLMEIQNDDFLPSVYSSVIVSTSPDRPHHPGVFFTTEHCCEGQTWNWKSLPSLEKTQTLGKIGGRRRGQQRMRWLDGITDSMDMNLRNFRRWWRTGKPGMLPSMGSQKVRHDWAIEQHSSIFILSGFHGNLCY